MGEQSAEPRIRLILLPGLDGTGDLSRRVADALSAWIDPLIISYPPAQSLSYDRLLEKLVASLPSDGRVAILGESYSGPLAIRIAAEHPERIAALILSTTFPCSPLPQWMRSLRFLVRPAFLWAVRWRPFVRFFLLNGAPTDRVTPVLDAIRRVRLRVVADRIREVAAIDVRGAVRSVAVPTLILSGRFDRVVSRRVASTMAELAGHARLVELDAPHLLLHIVPDRAADVIAEFLACRPDQISLGSPSR